MTTLREAAQQALEALTPFVRGNWTPGLAVQAAAAMERLEAALAEPVEPVKQCMAHGECFGGECIYQRPAEPVQEPVAWLYRGNLHATDPSGWCIGCPTPLYTAPPQRKPLTDEEIDSIWDSEKAFADIYAIARAIERAHNITGDNT